MYKNDPPTVWQSHDEQRTTTLNIPLCFRNHGDVIMVSLTIESYDDIKNLWENRIEESTKLEFKAEIDANNKEIAKNVSAMANAEGGIIIYGLGQDEKGRAKFSNGMSKEKRSQERFQQIIDSNIHPPLDVRIFSISARNESDEILEDREFLVVKIPQSFYHIHQVESTGRFYIRSNNTIRRMNEAEIEIKYEMRFKEKEEGENLFEKKENELRNQHNIRSYMFCGSITQIRYGSRVEITKELFRNLMFIGNKSSFTPLYPRIRTFTLESYPKGNDRFAEDMGTKQYLEINDNKSLFYLFPLTDQNLLYFDYFYWFADFLSVTNNFYKNIDSGDRITVLLKFAGIKGMMKPREILNIRGLVIPSPLTERNDRIREESMAIKISIESIPFNLRETAFQFFEEFWKRLQVDNPLEIKAIEAKYLEDYIKKIEENLGRIP